MRRAVSAALAALALACPAAASAKELYVVNQGDDNLGIVDLGSRTMVATVPVGDAPVGVAVAPNGKRAYVTNANTNDVSVVDLVTRTVVDTVAVGASPAGLAVTPDGSRVYVANNGTNTVSVIDTATDTVVGTIVVGAGPRSVAVSPDGTRVYVSSQGANNLSVIDAASAAVTNTLPMPNSPLSLSETPDGSRLYIGSALGSLFGGVDITVLNTSTLTNIHTLNKQFTFALGVSPDGSRAYAVSGTLSVVNLAGTFGSSVAAPSGVNSIAITPDSSRIYIPSNSLNQVMELTASPLASVGPINVGAAPMSVAISPDQGPTASFAKAVGAENSVVFDGRSSSDPDRSITRYDWDFGDGVTAADGGPTPTHIYAAAGTYDVKLTVTSSTGCSTRMVFTGQTASCNGGSKAEFTRSVTLGAAPPPPAPTCSGDSVAVGHDQAAEIALSCAGDIASLSISQPPLHGTLSAIDQSAGTVVYTPASGYAGTDSFRFNAGGPGGTSQQATIALTIGPAAPSPPAPIVITQAPPPPPDRIAPLLSIPRLLGGRVFRVFTSEPSTVRIGISRCRHGRCRSVRRITKVTTKASTLEVTLARRLPPGSYLLSAYAVDSAGNRSPTEKRRVTVR